MSWMDSEMGICILYTEHIVYVEYNTAQTSRLFTLVGMVAQCVPKILHIFFFVLFTRTLPKF